MIKTWMRNGFLQAPVCFDAASDKAAADAAAASKVADDKAAADAAAKASADKVAADAAAAAEAAKKTGDQKPGDQKDGKVGDGSAGSKDGEAPPPPKAPKDYALKIPEGGYLKEADLARVRSAAEIYGWTEEQTQEEINLHSTHVKALSDSFLSEAKADPEFGGAKFDSNRALAEKALQRVRPEGHPRSEALRGLLSRSGYNHNVEVLALLADFGRMLSEDGGLRDTNQGGDPPAPKDAIEERERQAKSLYPNDK